jgi:hypothetical protein
MNKSDYFRLLSFIIDYYCQVISIDGSLDNNSN